MLRLYIYTLSTLRCMENICVSKYTLYIYFYFHGIDFWTDDQRSQVDECRSTAVSQRSSVDYRRQTTFSRRWTIFGLRSTNVGRQPSVVGGRSSVVGRWSSVDDRRVVGRRSTIIDRRPSTNDIRQSVVGHQLPVASDVRWFFTFQCPIRCCCRVVIRARLVKFTNCEESINGSQINI